MSDSSNTTFRANAGIILVNDTGHVLALERLKIPGAWQLPQGGLGPEEEPINAAKRELLEETGIRAKDIEFLAEHPEWLAYELPKEHRSTKTGRGQVQKWFVFKFTGLDSDINLKRSSEQESRAWKWVTMKKLTSETVSFRRRLYERLERDFHQYLARE